MNAKGTPTSTSVRNWIGTGVTVAGAILAWLIFFKQPAPPPKPPIDPGPVMERLNQAYDLMAGKPNAQIVVMSVRKSKAERETLVKVSRLIGIGSPVSEAAKTFGHFVRGVYFHLVGNFSESIASYRKAIEIDDKYARAHAYLGVVLSEPMRKPSPEDMELAMEHYQQAHEYDKNDVVSTYSLGVAYWERKDSEEAIKWLELARTAASGDFVEPFVVLADLYGEQGNKRKAIGLLEEAHSKRPQDFKVINNLAYWICEEGNCEEAIPYYHKAAALDPEDVQTLLPKNEAFASVHNNLGHTLLRLGRPDEAATAFRSAIALMPTSVRYHYMLGHSLEKANKLAMALEALLNAQAHAAPDSELGPKIEGNLARIRGALAAQTGEASTEGK